MTDNPGEKQYTFGTCEYSFTSPDQTTLSPQTKIMNIVVPFEQALKLNLGIDECIRKLNRYKRSTKEGKRAAVNICLHLDLGRIAVNEGKLKK